MATETLKIVITADNKGALGGLQQTAASVESVTNASSGAISRMGQLSTSSNTAAFALTNVGRVAQDLPFGFMGIQNNLNPLLESFQRLKAETGTTGGALKALGSSLMGAGGLGLALSVASSAFLIFGDKLFDSSKKADAAKKSIDEATSSVAKDAAQINVLAEQYKNTNLSLEQRGSILKQLNSIAPEYFNGLKAENTTYDDLKKNLDAYTASLANQIKAKIRGVQLEKDMTELLKKQDEQKKVIAIQEDFAMKNKTGRAATGSTILEKEIVLLEKKISLNEKEMAGLTKVKALDSSKDSKSDKSPLQKLSETYKADTAALVNMLMEGAMSLDEFQKKIGELNIRTLQNFFKDGGKAASEFGQELIKLQPRFSEFGQVFNQENLIQRDKKFPTQQGMINKILPEGGGIQKEQLNAGNGLDKINAALAQTQQIMSVVGPQIDNLFTALENGASIGEALGDMFKKLAEDIAKAAIKALIFQIILSAVSGGTANAAGGGFGSIFKKMLGFAKGGISEGPQGGHMELLHGTEAILTPAQMSGLVRNSMNAGAVTSMGSNSQQQGSQQGEFTLRGNDLVLALQRSNVALNLRRGN